MPSKLTLTCDDYEIARALRHWRLDRNVECDAGEFNLSGYYMARDRGHPYIALPIFLHRRFRHGFLFDECASVGTEGY